MSRRRSARPPVLPRAKPGRTRPTTGRREAHHNVREAAGWVVEQTLASMSPVDTYLDHALTQADPLDRGLLCELVLGTLRWLKRLDYTIGLAAHRDFDQIEPRLRVPLRLAAYQLFFLDRMPEHAIVHEAVEHARRATHRGGASFVNAVLRRLSHDRRLGAWPVQEASRVRRLAIEHSHPELLVERWLERFGEATTRNLLATNNRPKPVHVLAFKDRGGRELAAESLIDDGVEVEASRWAPLGLVVTEGDVLDCEAFAEGNLYIQDEASQTAALIPPPRAGERILDLAAAPGGKTFSVLALEPTCHCVMADVSLARLRLVRDNLKRLKRQISLLSMDGAQPALCQAFDRVILDLPCSGTGTLRKHPELKWRLTREEISRLAAESMSLLLGAADLVAANGLLVAMTCSIEAEENELMVAEFLRRRGDYAPLPLHDMLPKLHQSCIAGDGLWRLLPGEHHDGFTVHVLVRAAA